MTARRKILLCVALLLIAANGLWLLVQPEQRVRALWFGSGEIVWLPSTQSRSDAPADGQAIVLERSGATLQGRPVPYIDMIDNVGANRFSRELRECQQAMDCPLPYGPWTAMALVRPDTPISVVEAAYQAVRATCNVQVVIFSERQDQEGFVGNPVMIAWNDDPALLGFGATHPWNSSLMTWQEGETLDQFGQRTGCARVSPLRD